jgi:lipopolysaccharide export system protein LptA
VWTPKRILILLGGLAVFVAGYFIYSYFLGGIDGLPVLTAEYLPLGKGEQFIPPPIGDSEGDTAAKLKKAFSAECEELKRAIKLNLPSRGILLAAEQFDIEKDGRVKLSPFSAAVFHKDKGDVVFPKISTVQCYCAYLKLDRPVSNFTELSNRKIMQVELVGKPAIILISNNGTPEKSDDIEVTITEGPETPAIMFYDELTNLIWTDAVVRLLDLKTTPETKIIGRGMELKLAEGSGLNRTKNTHAEPKPKEKKLNGDEDMSGLDSLTLKDNVKMWLYLDANSSFPGAPADAAKSKQPPTGKGEVPEKSEVTIQTGGPFHYDVRQKLATFDISGAKHPNSPDQVEVIRKHKGMKFDTLLCDHLELLFRKKVDADPKKPRESMASDNEIVSGLATARGKELVHLIMEIENVEAEGSELLYLGPTADRGPRTILKGSAQAPITAIKEGHKIQAIELHLTGADAKGNGQQAYAKGPGKIDFCDKANPKNEHPSYAKWNDSLTLVKVRDGDKLRDLITLSGDASFVDDEHHKRMNGQRLLVWLDADNQTGDAGPKRELNATNVSKQQIHRIEAFDKVSAFSPEMIVHYAKHLLIAFKNEPVRGGLLPEVLPGTQVTPVRPPMGAAPGNVPTPPQGAATSKSVLQTPTNSKKPIELTADNVEANVMTLGDTQELKDLKATGAVHVFQEGEMSADKKTQDKGLDIKGDTLTLVHHLAGNILVVYGNAKQQAQLQLGELHILGPQVAIDQKENIAEVTGAGAMSLPSDKSFNGGKSVNGPSRLTIHWKNNMYFDGRTAEFHGKVQADQDSATMICENLFVTLDRMVSFKEGQKDQKPNVESLTCDRSVWIEDSKRDAKGKRVQFDRLAAYQLNDKNKEGRTIATGPGKVEHLAASADDDPLAAPGQQAKGPKKEEVLKLTRIFFEERMFSNNTANSRTTFFYKNVEVYHFPTEDPDAKMNPDNPPKDGFYLSCNNLKAYTRFDGNKSTQMMQAENNVFFRTKEFFGRAAVVKYNEALEQVIFEGVRGSPATLYRQLLGRSEPQEIKGSRIIYNRRTGDFQLEGGNNISGTGN